MNLDRLTIPQTRGEAVEALRWCIDNIGGGFHPDTSGSEYVTYTDPRFGLSNPMLTPEQCVHYDRVLDAIFDHLDADADEVYAIGLDIIHENDGTDWRND